MEVVVVGAGVFGAALAWQLARTGETVTIVDQLEPGDLRGSSGGESRLLRCAHGPAVDYTTMARRARALWRELEDESGEELYLESGVAWFAHREDGWEGDSQRTLSAAGIPVERLDPGTAGRLFPSFRGDDLAFALHESEAGVLRAERSVRALVGQALGHRATLVRGRARPDGGAVVLEDGSRLAGDVVVWACGPWLAGLFPDLVSLRVTKQELLFLDGGPAWRSPGVPAWCDYDSARYGTRDVDALGVKVAVDDEGPPLHPDAPLTASTDTEPDVRAYLRERFPALADAPLVGARSCRYEITPDTHFVAAQHPERPGVWLVGGGSGHGFKHGPALAERLVAAFAGAQLPAHFGLYGRTPSGSPRTAGSRR